MKKAELTKLMEQKRKQGYITHSLILCIFNDTEDIDDKYLDLLIQEPQPPKDIIIHTSPEGLAAYNKAMEEFVKGRY